MNKIITIENLHSFCYLNDDKVLSNPKGLIVEFIGLGGQRMFTSYDAANIYSEHNILFMVPYINPWNWMNDQAIQEVNELIEVVKEKYQMPSLKVASTGGSMGGMSALTYSAYAKEVPAIVVANCPVCDLEYHYTERPDLPRTMYSAFYDANSPKDLQDVLKEHSPLRLAEAHKLPETKYVIFHAECDSQVNIHKHTEKLLEVMNKQYDVEFTRVPNKDHCGLDEAAAAHYREVLLDTFK